MKALGCQPLESTSLSKIWFQIFNLHLYNKVSENYYTHVANKEKKEGEWHKQETKHKSDRASLNSKRGGG